jgi:hypothetical protein
MMTEHYTHLSDSSAAAMAASFPKLLSPADDEHMKAVPRFAWLRLGPFG